MLQPHEWAVLTAKEAVALVAFIEKATASKGLTRDYEKMQKAGILEIYNGLREFVEGVEHYEDNLRRFEPSDYARDDHEHHRCRPED